MRRETPYQGSYSDHCKRFDSRKVWFSASSNGKARSYRRRAALTHASSFIVGRALTVVKCPLHPTTPIAFCSSTVRGQRQNASLRLLGQLNSIRRSSSAFTSVFSVRTLHVPLVPQSIRALARPAPTVFNLGMHPGSFAPLAGYVAPALFYYRTSHNQAPISLQGYM